MRRAVVVLLIALSASLGAANANSGQLERVHLPMIARSSCSELCGYCETPPWLDHVMGC